MRSSWFALIVLLVAGQGQAGEGRYVKTHGLAGGRVAVVAEADLEPRSVGSYSVRIYGARNSNAVTDDFLGGIIRPRDGTIENVVMADLDGDGTPELVVVIRNAGSGSYLSADAFSCEGRDPALIASVGDLPKDADVLAALREQTRSADPPKSLSVTPGLSP